MKNQNSIWIDKIINRNFKDEVPTEVRKNMEEEIKTFCKNRKDRPKGLFNHIQQIFRMSPSLVMVKNGLLTLAFVIGTLLLPATSTATSPKPSTESFENLKYTLTLMVALDGIREMETQVQITFLNGTEKTFKTLWEEEGFIIPPPQGEIWLKPFLTPDSLKTLLNRYLVFNKDKKALTFNIQKSAQSTIGSITLKSNNYLPHYVEGLSGPAGETARIIYHCKEYSPSSPMGNYLTRRKNHE